MRILGAIMIVLVGLGPTFGQTQPAVKPAAKPAKPAAKPAAKPPAPGSPKAVYAAMAEAERLAIQTDLVWTGDYNGIVAAELGDRAIAAIKAFQKRNGAKETGILNPDERGKLAQAARPKQAHVGWRMAQDLITGARLGIPGKLVTSTVTTSTGTKWSSGRGEVQIETFRVRGEGSPLAAVFAQQKKEPSGRKVEYQVFKPEFFVLSGLQGLKKFYVRAQPQGGEVRGVTILYDQAMDGIMEPVVVAMSNTFMPFPTGQQAGPPPRPKVEYGTGVVISTAGHVLTDRQLLDGCQVVTVAGLGPADRIAEDKASDLALLRIYGARDLMPAKLAAGPTRETEVSLMGIADPDRQNGGAEISVAKARLTGNGGRALDPVPGPGFSGAVALDGGRFVGVVGLKAPPAANAAVTAALAPADAVRTFLYAQSIAPESGSAGIDAAKAALVRVICVRK